MYALDVGSAVVVLVVLVVGGTILHELLHLLILRVFGIPYSVEWFSVSHIGSLQSWLSVKWATVTPDILSEDVSPWHLRLAAIAPLTIAAPFLLAVGGVVPNPFADGTVLHKLAVIALLACAIPSPDDFSLFWHAEQVVSESESTSHS